jgi:hypothetical protein
MQLPPSSGISVLVQELSHLYVMGKYVNINIERKFAPAIN